MYWSWQIVSTTISDISDVIFVQKICFNVSLSISLSLFFVFRSTGPGSPTSCCERESLPLLRLSPWSRCYPGCSQRLPLGAQDRCLPNAFPRVLVEALLTFVGEDGLAILVQVVWLVKWSFR